MKNLFTALLIMFGFFGNSQEYTVTITKEGINSVVNETEGKTEKENYNTLLQWIKKNYKSPDYVVKSTIEDKYIRFSDYNQYKAKNQPGLVELNYLVEVEFKDNRFKVTYVDVTYHNGRKVPESLYKSNGEDRKDQYYISSKKEIERILGEMNLKIYKILTEKSDW